MEATIALAQLSERAFENLIYDVCVDLGLLNVVWRTPGADGGRDITARHAWTDPTGYQVTQEWYIECKKYQSSVSWPTLYEKIAHADALCADYLLLATTSTASPTCEDRMTEWNKGKRRPFVRVLSHYEIETFLASRPAIGAKFGLTGIPKAVAAIDRAFAHEIAKVTAAAHAATILKKDASRQVEYAANLSSLMTERVDQLRRFGRYAPIGLNRMASDYEWIDLERDGDLILPLPVATVLTYLRMLSGCRGIKLTQSESGGMVATLCARRHVIDLALSEARSLINNLSSCTILVEQNEVAIAYEEKAP